MVRLNAEAIERVKEEIPFARFHRQRRRAKRFGIDALDGILRASGTHSIRRLFRMGKADDGLFGYYVIRFDRNHRVGRLQAALRQEGMVVSARPDYYRRLLDGSAGTAMVDVKQAIDWPAAVAADTSLPRPVIAIVDTGIQMSPPHPNLVSSTMTVRDVVDLHGESLPEGWLWSSNDMQGEDEEPIDEVGHGTHVAGIVAGAEDGTFSGIAPRARIVAIRALARTVRGCDGLISAYGSTSNIAMGINFATQQGASVINLSFGFEDHSQVELSAIDRARQKGCVLIAAIGNEGASGPDLYPARYRGVLAVGANRADGGRWPASQTGSHLFLMAPGESIVSCTLGSGFEPRTGTSMACAVVSAVVALMKSVQPNLTPDRAALLLRQTARPGTDRNDQRGWGSVNARAAVLAARG